MGFAIPLVAQVLGDIVFGLMSGEVWQAVSMSTLVNYILVGCSVVVGTTLQPRPALGRLFGTGASVAIGHFLLSNLAVWGLTKWYPHSLEGLAECFAQALPFFPKMWENHDPADVILQCQSAPMIVPTNADGACVCLDVAA